MGYELVPIDEGLPKWIPLTGFTIYVHSPSENAFKILTVDFTNLPPDKFYAMIDELGDVVEAIDEEYRDEKRGKGRGTGRSFIAEFIRAYKQRGGGKESKRILPSVSPYPKRFTNIVNYVRTQLYDALNDKAIVIQSIGSGDRYKRNIYLMPRTEIDEFYKIVDRLNEQLDKLRKMIDEYHESEHFKNILSILDKYGVDYTYRKAVIRNITIDPIPALLDIDTLKPVISERILRDIERQKEKVVSNVIEKFRKELESIIDEYRRQILKNKFSPEEAKKQLKELRDRIEGMGIISVRGIIEPLMEMVDDPERLIDEGYKKASGKIKALVSSLGIQG